MRNEVGDFSGAFRQTRRASELFARTAAVQAADARKVVRAGEREVFVAIPHCDIGPGEFLANDLEDLFFGNDAVAVPYKIDKYLKLSAVLEENLVIL